MKEFPGFYILLLKVHVYIELCWMYGAMFFKALYKSYK